MSRKEKKWGLRGHWGHPLHSRACEDASVHSQNPPLGEKRRGRGAGRLRHLGEQERKSHAPCLLLLLFPHLILMNNTWRGMGGRGGFSLKGASPQWESLLSTTY